MVLFLPPFVMMTMYLALIFPNGELLSPRWRIVAGVVLVAVIAFTLVELLRPGPLQSFPEIDNPLGVPGATASIGLVTSIVDPLFLPVVAPIGLGVVLRYRRATTVERRQFKWVALPAAVLLVFLSLNERSHGLADLRRARYRSSRFPKRPSVRRFGRTSTSRSPTPKPRSVPWTRSAAGSRGLRARIHPRTAVGQASVQDGPSGDCSSTLAVRAVPVSGRSRSTM